MHTRPITTAFLVLFCILGTPSHSMGQGSAFVYQAHLTEENSSADADFDFRFRLFSIETGGVQIGSAVEQSAVRVKNGLFTVTLDFGVMAFDGNSRWLEIEVRRSGQQEATYVVLNPRQQIGAAPYALLATKAAGLIENSVLSGNVTFSPGAGAPFQVTTTNKVESLNADLLDGLDSSAFALARHHHEWDDGCCWRVGGNEGGTNGVPELGTTDDTGWELKVNNTRVMRWRFSEFYYWGHI